MLVESVALALLEDIWRFAELHLAHRAIGCLLDVVKDILYNPASDLGLSDIRPVKTINAVCPEYSSLQIDHSLLAKSLFYKEIEFGQSRIDILDQLIKFLEVIAVCLSVKVIPDMLHVFALLQLKQLNQRFRQLTLVLFCFLD